MAAGALLPSGYETLEDANGVTIPGGLIWTYAAGTTTPLATYTDSALGVANTNPIIADGAGRWLAYAAPGTGFKFVFETPAIPPAHGATIKTCDNVAAPLTDATAGATGGATVISDNTTGTQNNFILPGRTKDTLWLWNGTADLTLTGIAGGASGDRITIKNMAAAPGRRINLAYQSASSTNPFANLIVSAATPVTPSGWVTYVFVGGVWVMTDHQQGDWFPRVFLATNYAASTGTWTVAAGGVTRDASWLSGRTQHYAFDVVGATSVVTQSLLITPPMGFLLGAIADTSAVIATLTGTLPTELAMAQYGGVSTLAITRAGGNFPVGANIRVLGMAIFSIQ